MYYYDNIYSDISGNIEIFNQKLGREIDSVNHVFTELIEMRKYGIKSAAFKENIISEPSDYWIYHSSDIFTSMYDNSKRTTEWQILKKDEMLAQKNLASVSICNKRNLELSRIKTTLDNGEETFLVGTNSKAGFSLNFSGELSIMNSVANMDLRQAFNNGGKSDLYEMVRANAIFRLYDLIVPVYVEKAYSVPRFPEKGLVETLFSKNTKFDPMLYLSRIRILFNNLANINKELEIEYEDSVNTRPSHVLKREHDVVYHIRKLGNGYQPSERARNLAKEIMNYDLKEGETFVCGHTRGKGGVKSDQLHLAIKKH
jgi:hypothetical protein